MEVNNALMNYNEKDELYGTEQGDLNAGTNGEAIRRQPRFKLKCVDYLAFCLAGLVYIKCCPNSPEIPILLITTGALMLLDAAFRAIVGLKSKPTRIIKIISIALNILAFVSFFILLVLVYVREVDILTYPVFNDLASKNYCNQSLFRFAFWAVSYIYIMYLLSIFNRKYNQNLRERLAAQYGETYNTDWI